MNKELISQMIYKNANMIRNSVRLSDLRKEVQDDIFLRIGELWAIAEIIRGEDA